MSIFLVFAYLSGLVPQSGFLYYFFQNLGVFFAFTTILAAYSGVYRISAFNEGSEKTTSRSIKLTALRFHYVLGLTVAAAVLFALVIFIETGISAVSYIPYAGPVITAILTIPFFLVNFACLLLMACLIIIAPPLTGETKNVKETINGLTLIIRAKWITLIIYTLISMALFFLLLQIVYFFIQYSVGITKAAQWKIQFAYPDMVNRMSMRSTLSDIAIRVLPGADLVSPSMYLQRFVTFLRGIVGLGYLAAFTFIAAFPLTAYFSISAEYFKSIWKDTKKKAMDDAAAANTLIISSAD